MIILEIILGIWLVPAALFLIFLGIEYGFKNVLAGALLWPITIAAAVWWHIRGK